MTQNIAQYPLHHVIYASAKFEVAAAKGLREDTITRNVMDRLTDRPTDWYEISIPYFSYKKAGIKREMSIQTNNDAWNHISPCLTCYYHILTCIFIVFDHDKDHILKFRTLAIFLKCNF